MRSIIHRATGPTYSPSGRNEAGRDPDVPVTWRFSLENPRTGQRHGFATLGALITALEQEMAGTWTGDKDQEHQ